jgi:hypothetical protein
MRSKHQTATGGNSEAVPASATVKYQRIETLGAGPVKGKQRDRAYFAIMYAAAECDLLGNGMEACGNSLHKKSAGRSPRWNFVGRAASLRRPG